MTNRTLITAQANHKVWTLNCEEPSIINSLTCPRHAASRSMGWERAGVHTFMGRFYSYADVRQNLYRLVMRSTTYGFNIRGCADWIEIEATDDGYVDRLPVLAKHSATGKSGIGRQHPLIAPANLDVSSN